MDLPGSDALSGMPHSSELESDAAPWTQPTWTPDAATKLRALVDQHHAFVWRSLRRLGVPTDDVDDAVQKVFLVVAKKLANEAPQHEKAYLFAVAYRVASDARRSVKRRREVATELPITVDEGPTPEEAMRRSQARAVLDTILDAMPLDLRAVFVLHELEETSMREIAELVGVPPGTVASRLRRAREEFEKLTKRFRQASEERSR